MADPLTIDQRCPHCGGLSALHAVEGQCVDQRTSKNLLADLDRAANGWGYDSPEIFKKAKAEIERLTIKLDALGPVDLECESLSAEVERLTAERDGYAQERDGLLKTLGNIKLDSAFAERDRLRAALVSAEKVMSGIGAWLLNRFGRNKPETLEGDTLLSAAKDARKALAGAASETSAGPCSCWLPFDVTPGTHHSLNCPLRRDR